MGIPASGTSMLTRFLADRHDELTIPAETHRQTNGEPYDTLEPVPLYGDHRYSLARFRHAFGDAPDWLFKTTDLHRWVDVVNDLAPDQVWLSHRDPVRHGHAIGRRWNRDLVKVAVDLQLTYPFLIHIRNYTNAIVVSAERLAAHLGVSDRLSADVTPHSGLDGLRHLDEVVLLEEWAKADESRWM